LESSAGVGPGQVVGRYELLERIGGGGFGEVWRARRLETADAGTCPPTFFALKFARGPEAIAALRREGALQSKLDHSGIVRVVEQDLAHEPPYIAFEHCPRGNLRAWLGRLDRGSPQTPLVIRTLLVQVAAALAHAHERGVVHGDLKPENIVFDGEDRPKITDFGLGTTVAGAEVALSCSLASVELGGGTLAYLAPERHSGAPASPAGDVWSFGIILFEAVFGRLPQGIEALEFPLGAIFGRCYTAVSRRLADGGALADAFAEPGLTFVPPSPPPPRYALERFGGPMPHRPRPAAGRGRKFIFVLVAAPIVASVLAGAFDAGPSPRRSRWPDPVSYAPAPDDRYLVDIEASCRRAADALRRIPAGGAKMTDWNAASALDAEIQHLRLDYRLTPDTRTGTIHAYPRHPGWPAFVCDTQGLFRKE
jgi:serine/threonine protein kinase